MFVCKYGSPFTANYAVHTAQMSSCILYLYSLQVISFSSQINSISAVLVYIVSYRVMVAQLLNCFGVPIEGGYQQRRHAVLVFMVYVCIPVIRLSLGRGCSRNYVIHRIVHFYLLNFISTFVSTIKLLL